MYREKLEKSIPDLILMDIGLADLLIRSKLHGRSGNNFFAAMIFATA